MRNIVTHSEFSEQIRKIQNYWQLCTDSIRDSCNKTRKFGAQSMRSKILSAEKHDGI